MKRTLHFIIFSFVIAFLFTGKSFSQNNNADTIYIGSNDGINPAFAYYPSSITVAPGDSVLFICLQNNHPTVPLSAPAAWATPNPIGAGAGLTVGQKQQVKITSTTGTYTYECSFHHFTGTIIVSNISGINDPKESKFEFSAAPNPFDDQLSMNINIGGKNVTDIKIYDIIGKEVASVNLSGKTGIHSYKVDTSNLKPGIYFCTVFSSSGILETKKLFRRN
jgi:plastocyanin